jgi:hypothetical protein
MEAFLNNVLQPPLESYMPKNTAETAANLWGELGCKNPNAAYSKLVNLRRLGDGPPCYKTGSGPTCQVMYEREDVLSWIQKSLVRMGQRDAE